MTYPFCSRTQNHQGGGTKNLNHGLDHSQNRTHTTSTYDTNYGDNEVSSHSDLKELTRLRLENEVLIKMLMQPTMVGNQ